MDFHYMYGWGSKGNKIRSPKRALQRNPDTNSVQASAPYPLCRKNMHINVENKHSTGNSPHLITCFCCLAIDSPSSTIAPPISTVNKILLMSKLTFANDLILPFLRGIESRKWVLFEKVSAHSKPDMSIQLFLQPHSKI